VSEKGLKILVFIMLGSVASIYREIDRERERWVGRASEHGEEIFALQLFLVFTLDSS
jgi:hypothetical protein